MNFQATITHPRTNEHRTFTQDTLDEFKAELKALKIKGQTLDGRPSIKHPKHLTLTALEKEWLGMTVETRFGRGEVFSMGPLTKTVWVILEEATPLAIHFHHVGSTDRMVCLRYDECKRIASWQKRAESLF